MITADQLQKLLFRTIDWIESPSLELCFDCLERKRDFAGLIIHKHTCRRSQFIQEVWNAAQEEILHEVQPEEPMSMNILAWEALEARAEKAEAGLSLLRDYLLEVRKCVSGMEAACIDMLLLQAESPSQPILVGYEVSNAEK